MRTVFTVAAGLVATVSATNLRSETATSKAALVSIEALAEKYDCETGEKGLEQVISEISKENVKASSDLETSCHDALEAIQQQQDDENKRARGIIHDAPIHAAGVRSGVVGTAQTKHDALDKKHADEVGVKTGIANEKAAVRSSTTSKHNAQTAAYKAEVLDLVADRATAVFKFGSAMKSAKDDLNNGRSNEDDTRKNEITTASETRKKDDGVCANDYAARQGIVTSDTAIVAKLESLDSELSAMGGRDKPAGTALLELTAKVHANYEELLSKKSAEMVNFQAACNGAFETYNGELAGENARAKDIRDTTSGKHGAVYDAAAAAEGASLQAVVDKHAKDVDEKTTLAKNALVKYGRLHLDYVGKEEAYEIESIAVAAERQSTKEVAAKNRDSVESTRNEIYSTANANYDATEAEATKVLNGDRAECKAAFDKRISFLSGDDKVIAQLEPLLSKLSACSGGGGGGGQTALLEVGTGCALNDKKLKTLFLEKEAKAPRTTGSFADWKRRLQSEKDDASSIRTNCEKVSQDAYNKIERAAHALNNEQTAKATSDAEQATSEINQSETNANAEYDRRFTVVETPWLAAKAADTAAEAERDETAETQSAAEASQQQAVGSATSAHAAALASADQTRNERIQADQDKATSIDVKAKAAHAKKIDFKTKECDHENSLLLQEQKKLEDVVSHLSELKEANKGLDMESSGSIKEDIAYLKKKLEEEKVNSAKDQDSCLASSKEAERSSVASANDAYDTAYNILVETNTREVAAATAESNGSKKAHLERETTNESTNKESIAAFNKAVREDESASKVLKIATMVQKDKVGASATALAGTIKKALAEETKYVAEKNAEASTIVAAAEATFQQATSAKTDQCDASRLILEEEKDILSQTQEKISSLSTVGQTNDYSSTVKTL